MKTTPRILAESQFNPYGKEVVVVEGYSPEQVLIYLPNALLIIQNTDEEYENIFSCETGVLNTVKPSIFLCESPTDEQEKLCSVLGTVVMSLNDLKNSTDVVQKIEKATSEFVKEQVSQNSILKSIFPIEDIKPSLMFPYSNGETSDATETK